MKKYTDAITIGTIGGIAGSIVMTLLNWLLLWSGVHFTPPWEVSGNILLNTDVLYTPAGTCIGYLVQFLLGAGLGLIVAVIIKSTGKDYYWVKALGVAALFFIGNTGIMQRLADIAPWMRSEISSTLIALLNLSIIGFCSGFITVKYAEFNDNRNFPK